jgi:hypothetical protein
MHCHAIEFTATVEATSPRLGQLLLVRGDRCRAHLRPHVVETAHGPVEAADLFLEDGMVISDVPFACFHFLDRRHKRPRSRPAKQAVRSRPSPRPAILGLVQAAVFVAASSVATAAVVLLVPLLMAPPRWLFALAVLGAAAWAVLGIVCSWSRPRRSRRGDAQRRSGLLPGRPRDD